MSVEIEKVIQLGKKIINLREELSKNQQILSEWESEVGRLMGIIDTKEIKSEIDEVIIKKDIKEVERFDSPTFKKADPETYAKFQEPSPRFNQKKLKKEKPEIYEEYLVRETVENISIERYISKDSLPII